MPEKLEFWQFHLLPNPVLAGVAAAAGRSFVAPLSVTKIYAEVGMAGGKMGPIQAASWIRHLHGWKGFFRGNGVAAARLVPHVGVTVAVYNQLRNRIVPQLKPEGRVTVESLVATYLAGATGGVVATSLTHPLDLIKVRLTVNPVANPYYRGVQDAMVKIVTQEGIFSGLYRGFIMSAMGSAVFFGVFFSALEISNDLPWRRRNVPLFPLEWFIDPAVALGAAQFASHPFDVLRRKMMAYSDVLPKRGGVDIRCRSLLELLVQSVRTNGLWGFYHGWVSNATKVAPQLAVVMAVSWCFRRREGSTSRGSVVGGTAQLKSV